MASPRTHIGIRKASASGRVAETRAQDSRRGPDAVTNAAFAKIHGMRHRFSVSAVTEAMAKVRAKSK